MKNIISLVFLSLLFINSYSQNDSNQLNSDSSNIYLGDDFSLCVGYIHLLDAGTGYDSYIWQDGSTNQTFMVTEPGTFWVHAYLGATMYADTINIGYWPNPNINFGNDTTICHGSSFMLEAPPGCMSYLWMDGSTLPYYLVTTSGYYSVEVMDFHGCMDADTIFINYTTSVVELGSDTIICECGDPLLLDAGEEFVSYEWQDGSTSQYFEVDPEIFGIGSHYFHVTAIDSIGCESADTILIYISECINMIQTNSKHFRIYPNPAKDVINIDLQELPNDKLSIKIINTFGNIVFQDERLKTKNISEIRLDISNLKSGIYNLKIVGNKKKYFYKLLIQN